MKNAPIVSAVYRVDKDKLYFSAKTVWEGEPATEYGMTHFSSEYSRMDLSTSSKFIQQFYEVSGFMFCLFL